MWLAAKSDQLTYLQKTRGQQDGIEGFLRKEFKPGLGPPTLPPWAAKAAPVVCPCGGAGMRFDEMPGTQPA